MLKMSYWGGENIFLSCSYVHGKLYDASGKQINEKDITNTGKADVSIIASDFAPGIYIYSLIVDGKCVSSKRMIVTR